MVSKPALPLAVAAALLAAGCGSQTRTAATHTTPTTQIASAASTHLATAATKRRAAAGARPLGPHTSRPARGPADNEGPAKPRTSSALSPRTYRVVLRGIGKGTGTVSGSTVGVVKLIPQTRQVCWQFRRAPKVIVTTAAFGRVRMALRPASASIHQGGKGANGPAVVPLYARYAARGCTVAAPVVLNSIIAAPKFYYLSLGAATSPAGILRAQL